MPEQASQEADTLRHGWWEHAGRTFSKIDPVQHPGYIKVHGSDEVELSTWHKLEYVRRRLATPGCNSAYDSVHRKT